MIDLFAPMGFARGPGMKNRFMLAPLTNLQSHTDGRLSDDEYHWLVMRARGGFGLTMTCASHVQAQGQGFPGQLGCYADAHLEGLAAADSRSKARRQPRVRAAASRWHAARPRLNGRSRVAPSDDARNRSARILPEPSTADDVVAAAMQRCGQSRLR